MSGIKIETLIINGKLCKRTTPSKLLNSAINCFEQSKYNFYLSLSYLLYYGDNGDMNLIIFYWKNGVMLQTKNGTASQHGIQIIRTYMNYKARYLLIAFSLVSFFVLFSNL